MKQNAILVKDLLEDIRAPKYVFKNATLQNRQVRGDTIVSSKDTPFALMDGALQQK